MNKKTLGALLLSGFFFGACTPEKNPMGDLNEKANLRNVSLAFTAINISAQFPEGWETMEDSASLVIAERFRDASQYGFNLTLTIKATNGEDGQAQFDGMDVNTIPDTMQAEPVALRAEPFTVAGNSTLDVHASQTINLATHRVTGMYLLQRMASSDNYQFQHYPTLYAKIGTLEQSWDTPPFASPPVPPVASPEARRFAQLVLSLGLLQE